MTAPKLRMPIFLWLRLVWQLRRRGGGCRESGAFLLGPSSAGVVCSFVCYDDLDPHCLDTGIIRLDGKAYVPLWKLCAERKIKVLMDVHTHPSRWTGQSETDRTHPMVAQVGHLALILPHYGQHSWLGPDGGGFFRYLGSERWETIPVAAIQFSFF